MLMSLAQAHALLPGSRLVGAGATAIQRVHSDSRSLRDGDLFVALRGARFDAHDFLPQARAAGARAALAERGLAEAGLPGLLVPDTLLALQQLARAWRAQLTLPVIVVAGSNGKTTVTQMIAAILHAWLGDAALATAGNFNNHIGVPLQVLRLTPAHRVAVFELGMNHPGEIATLARIAQATVALVNNAQREHQEFMPSVQAVAEENGAVIAALPETGVAVYPADDACAHVWRALASQRARLTFSTLGAAADVSAEAVWVAVVDASSGHWDLALRTPSGPAALGLQVAGRHNVHNALAAASAALAAGAPLQAVVAGLQAFQPVAGRSQLGLFERDGQAVTLVDDSYNANPDSVRAAIDLLAALPGPHWLVLGDMGEVGEQGVAFHSEVGRHAMDRGIAALWTVGPLSANTAAVAGAQARHFDSVEALLAALKQAPRCASALVKGSRFMRMERVVAGLKLQAVEDAPHAA